MIVVIILNAAVVICKGVGGRGEGRTKCCYLHLICSEEWWWCVLCKGGGDGEVERTSSWREVRRAPPLPPSSPSP